MKPDTFFIVMQIWLVATVLQEKWMAMIPALVMALFFGVLYLRSKAEEQKP